MRSMLHNASSCSAEVHDYAPLPGIGTAAVWGGVGTSSARSMQ